jgi:hypothetical protein
LDLQNNKSNLSYVNTQLDLKQNNLTTSNKLESSKVSTLINGSNGILNNVLESLTSTTSQNASNISINSDNIITERAKIDGALIRIGTNEGNISTLNSQYGELNASIGTKNNIINSSNKVSSDFISTNLNSVVSTLSSVLNEFNTSIDLIDSTLDTKQNLLNSTTNKLPYTNINFTNSNWSNLDYNSSISAKFQQLDSQIQTITGINDFTTFDNMNIDIADLDNAIVDLQATKQNIITSISLNI